MSSRRNVFAVLFAATLAACGGGGGGGGDAPGAGLSASSGGTGGTGISFGVMTVGSAIVNGVRFEDSTANITIDDTPKTASDLRDGMVVKLRGIRNTDGVTGTAERIEVENEVRGTVQSTNPAALPPAFVVVDQTVLVDDLTVFASFLPVPASPGAAVAALTAATSMVEVHGQRDAAGNIRASRLELLTTNPLGDELRGRLTGLDTLARTFSLSAVPVSYGPITAITPAGASLAENARVEIHGSFNGATFVATRIDLEDLEDAQFQPGANDDVELEGFIVGFTVHPGTFTINGQTVQTTSGTRFENGSALDLADDVKVEAEGRVSGGTLVAEKISFRRGRVLLTGGATVTGTIPGAGTLEVFGKPIQITGLTEIDATSGITNEPVEVRGYVDSAGAIVAERIKDNPGGGGKDILQARVTDEVANVLTVLGIDADLTSATQFEDANDQPLSGGLSAFLAAVTPASSGAPGTLVKVKGTFNLGTIAVEEAELEN